MYQSVTVSVMSEIETRIKYLGLTDYRETWEKMKAFTQSRDPMTADELWITEHAPVFTQGHNGKSEHLLDTGDIPVIQIDRGGQVTYHGPGQLVLYCLLDINRLGLGVRGLVTSIENSIIGLLSRYNVEAVARKKAPGVYVSQGKIAALGLRIRKGSCYHGLSLNIDMDLSPFSRINPCGLAGQAVTQMVDLGIPIELELAGRELAQILIENTNRG
jgi:lipoyl(octanoyl) transferase